MGQLGKNSNRQTENHRLLMAKYARVTFETLEEIIKKIKVKGQYNEYIKVEDFWKELNRIREESSRCKKK